MLMDRWRRIVDHLLGEVIGDGDISHLPGAGKPLQLDDDPHTPGDQRAALKIMQDHNVSPEWIAAGKALEQNEERLLSEIAAIARRYKDASNGEYYNVPTTWSKFLLKFRAKIERHNRQVLLYNLKAPKGIQHKRILDCDALIARALQSIEQQD